MTRRLIALLALPMLPWMGCSGPTTTVRTPDAATNEPAADVPVDDKRWPTITFQVVDAATGEPLGDVTVTHERLPMFESNPVIGVTTHGTRLPRARVTARYDPDLGHRVRFARDGYCQVLVHVWKGIGGAETTIFVEPVQPDPRLAYIMPPSDVIVIPLNQALSRGPGSFFK